VIHDLAIALTDPPSALHRVGRLPNPLLLAPVDNQTWKGRFDDARRRRRTLYAAEDPQTCYFERLQKFRPSLELLALLEQIRTRAEEQETPAENPEALDYEILMAEAGTLDSDYFQKYARVAFLPEPSQLWLDLRDSDVLRQLRSRMAPWLHANRIEDFDFSDVVARDKRVTQHIASLAIDSNLAGVISLSRLNAPKSCWAIFEGAKLQPHATRIPITPDDRDFEKVLVDFNIRILGDTEAKPIAEAEVISTGGLVRGAEQVAESTHIPQR
jgi:hypothetical protein